MEVDSVWPLFIFHTQVLKSLLWAGLLSACIGARSLHIMIQYSPLCCDWPDFDLWPAFSRFLLFSRAGKVLPINHVFLTCGHFVTGRGRDQRSFFLYIYFFSCWRYPHFSSHMQHSITWLDKNWFGNQWWVCVYWNIVHCLCNLRIHHHIYIFKSVSVPVNIKANCEIGNISLIQGLSSL